MVIRRVVCLLAIATLVPLGQASIIIDTFEEGYHKATIVGEGGSINLATGLDRDKVFAGHRYTSYSVFSNPFGYTTTFEVGLGEAKVITPGPNDVSTELEVGYGKNFHAPLDLDLSAVGFGALFEIDLGTDPPGLFARNWSLNVKDGQGRSSTNETFGTRPGGIEFLKQGFMGNPDIDWSDIQTLSFLQRWSRADTAPLVYWATEFRAVPEPMSMFILAAALGTAASRKLRPAQRTRR